MCPFLLGHHGDLLLAFPDLKASEGPIVDSLRAAGAPSTTLKAWREIAAQEITAEHNEGCCPAVTWQQTDPGSRANA